MHTPFTRYIILLSTYLKPQWRRSLLLGLLILLTVGLQLLSPQILKTFIDAALVHGVSSSLLLIALAFLAVLLLKQGLAIASTYLGEYVAWTATNQLRSDLIAHCLTLDHAFHSSHTSGEMIERVDGDVNALANFFSQLFFQLFSNVLLLCGILIMFFRIDWRAGLGVTLYAAFFLGMLIILNKRLIPYWKAQRQASADFYGFLGERLAGVEDIRANGAVTAMMRRFLLLLRAWFPITYRTRMMDARFSVVNFTTIAAGFFLLFLLGAYLHGLRPTEVTVGTVIAMYNYGLMLLEPVWAIQDHIQDLQQVEACIQRVNELLLTTSALQDGQKTLSDEPLKLTFCDVTFGYSETQPVVRDIAFTVDPGKVLGIVGRTGSGKTTLARLIFRFYDPQHGKVYINDIPLRELSIRDLRQHIGLITQEVQLFHASIRDNLTFFNPTIPDAAILAALHESGLGAWYQSLPLGLESRLGPGGEGLSAGQAQLLAFARIFLTDPGIIVLDEASSRLDPTTERLLEQAMEKLLAGRTAIIIAHRLSTIQRAHDILLLENGEIGEYGARETLANDPSSHFSQLLKHGLTEALA
jgi:ATP-binding cassette subfamily B protein